MIWLPFIFCFQNSFFFWKILFIHYSHHHAIDYPTLSFIVSTFFTFHIGRRTDAIVVNLEPYSNINNNNRFTYLNKFFFFIVSLDSNSIQIIINSDARHEVGRRTVADCWLDKQADILYFSISIHTFYVHHCKQWIII